MNPLLILSAGHHEGAVGASSGSVTEWPLTSIWVKELAAMFPPAAPILCFTNELLSRKINHINSLPEVPRLAVEIHFNSSTRGGKGSETLYTPGSSRSKLIAEKVQAVIGAYSRPNRGIKEGWYKQDLERRIPDAFLSQTKPVAIILEPFFVQQEAECNDVELRQLILSDLAELFKNEIPELSGNGA